jgi:hypothetical protein
MGYIFCNIIFVFSLIVGFYLDNIYFENFSVFYAWATCILALTGMAISEYERDSTIYEIERPEFITWVSFVIDVFAVLVFIYHGYLWLSLIYLIATVNLETGIEKAKNG